MMCFASDFQAAVLALAVVLPSTRYDNCERILRFDLTDVARLASTGAVACYKDVMQTSDFHLI
jgi:hypothetical protein